MADRQRFLSEIARNISEYGIHFTFVTQGVCPRFAYSIGMHQTNADEYILAGALYYDFEQVRLAIETAVKERWNGDQIFTVPGVGKFTLKKVHESWLHLMMLGALDFYKEEKIGALQLMPEPDERTIDVPDMSLQWSSKDSGAWKWLKQPWPYPVAPTSTATTNMAALRGAAVTEAARWEDDQWELFAGSGPETPRDQIRVVPLGTLLAGDATLEAVVFLSVGKALWREGVGSNWRQWGS